MLVTFQSAVHDSVKEMVISDGSMNCGMPHKDMWPGLPMTCGMPHKDMQPGLITDERMKWYRK